MRHPAWMILRSREEFWGKVSEGRDIGSMVLRLVPFIVVCSAAYGVVLAGWRSPLLALYVAIKFPLLLLGTTSLVMLLNWMLAVLFGGGLAFKQVVAITFGAMGVACWILVSLIPVTVFFTFGVAEREGTEEAMKLTHNYLLLAHITLIAFAGVAGNGALRRGLTRALAPTCGMRRVYWGWLLSFAVVGCQLSWILRPFVGSPFLDVHFMRPGALDRNFFEFVFMEVIPNVLTGG